MQDSIPAFANFTAGDAGSAPKEPKKEKPAKKPDAPAASPPPEPEKAAAPAPSPKPSPGALQLQTPHAPQTGQEVISQMYMSHLGAGMLAAHKPRAAALQAGTL